MNQPLVLSLFPGIGLLDMAFEQEGFCVVRGPDLLWGGDVKRFHPPTGKFDGVIGGPPCKRFSRLARMVVAVHGVDALAPDLIPEFARVVEVSRPLWFVMENVPEAPLPDAPSYKVDDFVLDNAWLGQEQVRKRRFSWGVLADGPRSLRSFIHVEALMLPEGRHVQTLTCDRRAVSIAIGGSGKPKRSLKATVTSTDGGHSNHPRAVRTPRYSIVEACELQGLPLDFLEDAPFTASGKLAVVANGVPLPMGRAVARAVKQAMGYQLPVESEAIA